MQSPPYIERTNVMKTKSSTPTATDRTADALKILEVGIQRLTTSDAWARYLRMQAAFHQYSFANVGLILAQRPDATRVAGYRTWEKFERNVRKGEKAIWILAPRFYKPKTNEEVRSADDAESQDDDQGRIYFKAVPVFDISQTEGEPLPQVVTKLQGDDAGLFERVKAWSAAWGCPVTVEDFPGSANGFYVPERHAITVRAGMSAAQQLKTLLHELAHAHLHQDIDVYRAHRADAELEAESTAFVVMAHFGLDSGAYSFGYLSVWQGGDEAAIKALKTCAQRIQQTARAIINGIDGIQHGGDEPITV
jgi:antirestriction protein ArdC